MAYKFKIAKANSDISTKEMDIYFDSKKQLIIGTVFCRGDDYDSDTNYPYLEIRDGSSVVVATAPLPPGVLSNTEYKRFEIIWDPKKSRALDQLGNENITLYVKDEDGTIGGTIIKTFAMDLTPPTKIITPLSDGIQGNLVTVKFAPESIAWDQKFQPTVSWSVKETMSPATTVNVTQYRLRGTSVWKSYSYGGGANFIEEIGSTPMSESEIPMNSTGYIAGVSEFSAVADITSAGNVDLFFDYDYRSTRY